jgi:hypothetical protein
MTELTAEKIKELSTLLAAAPPATASRLLAMFERMKIKGSEIIPSNDLIVAMREAGMTQFAGACGSGVRMPSFDRLFFAPFEKLFESGDMVSMLPGSLPRVGLSEVWGLVVKDFVPDHVGGLKAKANAAILKGDIDEARVFAGHLRHILLNHLIGFSNETIAKLAKTPEAKAVLLRLVPLLLAEARGRDIWAMAFGRKGELSDQGVAALSDSVRALEDENSDAARELILLTMANLPHPSEAIRVLNKASYGVDDRRLDITEFSVIGRRLIATASRAADMINEASQTGISDGFSLAKHVDRYNQSLHGLEREAHLAPDGPWHQAMLIIRNKVGNQLETLCKKATHDLETALPVDRIQRNTLNWVQEPRMKASPDPTRVEMAVQGIAFIASTRLFAALAGFGAPREQAAKHATAYLDTICDALLRHARLPNKRANLHVWVQATASLIEALEGITAAHLFERRINSAILAE